jgi:hypothetical protein
MPIIAEKVGVDAPELPLSAHIWLDLQGVGNPHFLRLHPEATAGQRSAFDQQIWQLLEHEADGGHGFTPFAEFDPAADSCPQAVFRVPETPQVWRGSALAADR